MRNESRPKHVQYYERRQSRAVRKLGRSKFDTLLLTQLADIRYLCGFTGSSAVLVLTRNDAAFFTDGRYSERSHTQVVGVAQVIIPGNALRRPLKWSQESKTRRLRLDLANPSVSLFQQVQQ